MFAVITWWGLGIYLHAATAPIWRAIVTPEGAVWPNLVAAILVAVSLAFAARRLMLCWRKVVWSPILCFLTCFAMPPFVQHLAGLSPVMFMLAPVALSLATLGLFGREETDDDRVRRGGFSVRIACAGAFAAVAAWEGTIGLALSPVLLLVACLPVSCRDDSLFAVFTAWILGFCVAFGVEGICLGFPWQAFRPVLPPNVDFVVFFLVGLMPLALVRRFGENRWTVITWLGVLVVCGAITLTFALNGSQGGAERFARAVLADLGERKLIIGDGIFDDIFTLLKPEDVRLVGTRTNADREFMVNFFDDGAPVTNRALVVRQYYTLPEMDAAAAELGLRMRKPSAEETLMRNSRMSMRRSGKALTAEQTNAIAARVAAARSNELVRLNKAAEPMMKALAEIENAEFVRKPKDVQRVILDRARETIRRTLTDGTFHGTRLSNALLMADIQMADREVIESDAIMALMIDRNDPVANAALGALRQEEGKFEIAERYLRRGVKGGGVLAFGKLAILLIQTDRAAEAIEWARKAVEKTPSDRTMREPLAAALIECDRLDEAERELGEIERLAREQGALEAEQTFLNGARRRLNAKRKR